MTIVSTSDSTGKYVFKSWKQICARIPPWSVVNGLGKSRHSITDVVSWLKETTDTAGALRVILLSALPAHQGAVLFKERLVE